MDTFDVCLGALLRLRRVISDLAIETVVRHHASLRAPVRALAFDVEVLAGITTFEPALGPGAGGTENDDLSETVGHQRGRFHIRSGHPILTMCKRSF